MGRPPLGKRAMSSTERSHRYRAKHAATKTATKPGEADFGAQAAEIARLKAVGAEKDREIANLRRRAADAEAEAATLKQAQARPAAATSGGTDWSKAYSKLYGDHTRLMDKYSAVEKQLAAARAAAPGVEPDEEKASLRLSRELDQANAKNAKLETLLAGDSGELGKMARPNSARLLRIR